MVFFSIQITIDYIFPFFDHLLKGSLMIAYRTMQPTFEVALTCWPIHVNALFPNHVMTVTKEKYGEIISQKLSGKVEELDSLNRLLGYKWYQLREKKSGDIIKIVTRVGQKKRCVRISYNFRTLTLRVRGVLSRVTKTGNCVY